VNFRIILKIAVVVGSASGPAVMLVYKRLAVPALVFTGMLLIPAGDNIWIWTIVARERGITGVREAEITAQLIRDRKLTIDVYKRSWAQDPYEPTYTGVDRAALRY
jgi:hypothetical protein